MTALLPTSRLRLGALARVPTLLVLAVACILVRPGAGLGQDAANRTLLVLAAASLTDVLPAVAEAWREGGGIPVRFSFDATSRLAAQAVQSSADLFFAADEAWMEWMAERGAVDPARVRSFLGNELVLVVPNAAGAPVGIQDLSASGLVQP